MEHAISIEALLSRRGAEQAADPPETGAEEIEQALERLMLLTQSVPDPGVLLDEIRIQAMRAAEKFNECMSRQEYERAAGICDRLLKLCPGLAALGGGLLDLARSVRNQQTRNELVAAHQSASAAGASGEYDLELDLRLQVHRHPLRDTLNARLVLYNCVHALKHVLSVEKDIITEDDLALARGLLAAAEAAPITPIRHDIDFDMLACWEDCERRMLRAIDLDTIFSENAMRPLPLPTSFVSSAGEPVEIESIARQSRARGVKTVFACSTSTEYLKRYSHVYITSIFAHADCECLIVICLCVRHDELENIVADLGLSDARIVFCADGFDRHAQEFRIFVNDEAAPFSVPTAYFASAALLRADLLISHLAVPVFVTGIDTVLQHGVSELLGAFGDADVVLNKVGHGVALGSQVVNNLVLIGPTANGVRFVHFLKRYLGDQLAQPEQVGGIDQLCLHMAKHHLARYGVSPNIRYFGPFDINTLMFNRTNYRANLDVARRYRFLNMFVGAYEAETRLTTDQLVLAEA